MTYFSRRFVAASALATIAAAPSQRRRPDHSTYGGGGGGSGKREDGAGERERNVHGSKSVMERERMGRSWEQECGGEGEDGRRLSVVEREREKCETPNPNNIYTLSGI